MRKIKDLQLELAGTAIEDIRFNLKSRDDIPAILIGLQHIYTNPETREELFSLLEEKLLPEVDLHAGRPGMDIWRVVVLGALKQGLGCDYDRLHSLANSYMELRQMLGHGGYGDEYEYELQTITDNVSLLSPELLRDINSIVVRSGHAVSKKKPGEGLRGRCDSFPVKTDVEHPADVGLSCNRARTKERRDRNPGVLGILSENQRKKEQKGSQKPLSLLFFAFLSLVFCVNTSLAHDNPHSDKSVTNTTTARDVDNSDSDSRMEDLEKFVMHASLHLSGAKSFTEALHLLNDFRVNRSWSYGSTYLILLTRRGGVYIHPRDRELEDQDWSLELVGCNGESWKEVVDAGNGCVKYVNQPSDVRSGYAMVVRGPFVPFGNPRSGEEAEFVLVGGIDHRPEPVSYSSFEEIEDSFIEGFRRENPDITDEQAVTLMTLKDNFRGIITPDIDAGDVSTQDNLRTFLKWAVNLISASFDLDPLLDPVILRKIFRFEGGPLRNGSTYIYIMDIEGNVIFNGNNRNIEQTDLWNFEGEGEDLFIRRIIEAARKDGGGFVEYDWDDPSIEGDEPDEAGAAGGTSSKLGYAVLYQEQQEDHSRTYVFGTGLYLPQEELEDDGGDGCSLAEADSAGASIPANSFLITFLLFLAISVRYRCAGSGVISRYMIVRFYLAALCNRRGGG